MERLNSANDIDMELFDQYYEPGIEPLTKEEWWDILIRFDDSFTNHTPCKMKNIMGGKFEELYTPCENLFTKEEWSEILEQCDTTDEIETTEDDDAEFQLILEELELKYMMTGFGEHPSNKKTRKRSRLPRRGGRGGRRCKGTANINKLHSNCDGYTSKNDSIEKYLRRRKQMFCY